MTDWDFGDLVRVGVLAMVLGAVFTFILTECRSATGPARTSTVMIGRQP